MNRVGRLPGSSDGLAVKPGPKTAREFKMHPVWQPDLARPAPGQPVKIPGEQGGRALLTTGCTVLQSILPMGIGYEN